MERLLIEGGYPLKGSVEVNGAKNAAVALLPATVLAAGICTVENVPMIKDVELLEEILSSLGARVKVDEANRRVRIDTSDVNKTQATSAVARRMRASYYFLGALLGRFGHAEIALPGGCEIGSRPIDQHIKGLEALGATVVTEHGVLKAHADQLIGAEIYLDVASVGATINLMLAACRAKGNTSIVNAAKEPHVVDTANFLNSMGAAIKGAGTDVIRIRGREELHGSEYSIIPDQIEAGTLMIAAAATRGDVIIQNVIPMHMEALSAKLIEMGVEVVEGEGWIRVRSEGELRATKIKTLPYPGFPTDMQQPMMALLCTAKGISHVIETIYEERFKHIGELRRMGAIIGVDNRIAIVEGVDRLTGTYVTASDLRAGAALVVAGLMAEGKTYIKNVRFIDRGYEKIEQKLISLGAHIQRVEMEDEEDGD